MTEEKEKLYQSFEIPVLDVKYLLTPKQIQWVRDNIHRQHHRKWAENHPEFKVEPLIDWRLALSIIVLTATFYPY